MALMLENQENRTGTGTSLSNCRPLRKKKTKYNLCYQNIYLRAIPQLITASPKG